MSEPLSTPDNPALSVSPSGELTVIRDTTPVFIDPDFKDTAVMLDFLVYQDDTAVQLSTPITDSTAKHVIGSVLYRGFRWISLQRKFKTGALKFSKPIYFRFTFNGITWDSGKLNAVYTQRLKLIGGKAKTLAHYADFFFSLYSDATQGLRPVPFDVLMAGLIAEAKADAEADARAKEIAKAQAEQVAEPVTE